MDPAETLTLGRNEVAQNLEYVYVAGQSGTLYFSVVEMLYNGSPVTESVLGSSVQMTINGSSVSVFNKSYEVQTGDELALIVKDYSWDGSGVVSANVSLSFEGYYEHPLGSLGNPVELKFADCPTESIEIAAGSAAWYELESYYDDSSWSTVYPFDGKYLVVTGENAWVDVEGTVYTAENGMVKVLMDDETMIQIGNAGNAPAVFGISVEIPEGHVDNPQDLVEGDNMVTLPSYGTHYFDFTAETDGTVTVTVSGENWKYNFAHYDIDGTKLSGKDYYAKNGDSDTVILEMTAGQSIVVMVGTSKGYSQPGGDITVNVAFEPAEAPCDHANTVVTEDNRVEATCTADGSYEKVTSCADCGVELNRETVIIPAFGHDYQDGSCVHCDEADPNVSDNTVTVDIVSDVDVTNGVITATWNVAELTLTDIDVHADFISIKEENGTVTFGYVALDGIESGKSIATLTFEAVDPETVNVAVDHRERNNGTKVETQVIASGWSGYTTWQLTDDGTLTFSPTEQTENGQTNLKNYWKVNGVLTLPWSGYADQITKVVIEHGIHDLGQMAFYELPNLTTVELADSVVEIRNYTFKNCVNLTNINLEVVEYIREGAFYGCSSLEDVTFAEGVVIEDWAFSRTNVKLPSADPAYLCHTHA